MKSEDITIDYDTAFRAYAHNSHTPEERARQDIAQFHREIAELRDQLLGIGEDLGDDAFNAEVERQLLAFAKQYKAKYETALQARAKTVSTHVTGRASFNGPRNRRALSTEQRRMEEMVAWRNREIPAMKRRLKDVRDRYLSPEQRLEESCAPFMREVHDRLGTIRAIDTGKARGYDRTLFVSNLYGYLERRAKNGEVAIVDRALDEIRQYNEANAKPAFTSRHRIWKLADVARQNAKATAVALDEGVTVIYEGDGITVESDPKDERVRIVFPGKPDEAMRQKLKGAGWKWSPTNGAWQRRRTSAAEASARFILGVPHGTDG